VPSLASMQQPHVHFHRRTPEYFIIVSSSEVGSELIFSRPELFPIFRGHCTKCPSIGTILVNVTLTTTSLSPSVSLEYEPCHDPLTLFSLSLYDLLAVCFSL